jgi:hypothetical protein
LQVLVTGTGAAPFRPAAEGILFIFATWPSFQEAESAGAFPLPGKAEWGWPRLRGGRAAVKILCLLGRSRLRRKRGRLFQRLNGVRKTNIGNGVRKTNDWRPALSA